MLHHRRIRIFRHSFLQFKIIYPSCRQRSYHRLLKFLKHSRVFIELRAFLRFAIDRFKERPHCIGWTPMHHYVANIIHFAIVRCLRNHNIGELDETFINDWISCRSNWNSCWWQSVKINKTIRNMSKSYIYSYPFSRTHSKLPTAGCAVFGLLTWFAVAALGTIELAFPPSSPKMFPSTKICWSRDWALLLDPRLPRDRLFECAEIVKSEGRRSIFYSLVNRKTIKKWFEN